MRSGRARLDLTKLQSPDTGGAGHVAWREGALLDEPPTTATPTTTSVIERAMFGDRSTIGLLPARLCGNTVEDSKRSGGHSEPGLFTRCLLRAANRGHLSCFSRIVLLNSTPAAMCGRGRWCGGRSAGHRPLAGGVSRDGRRPSASLEPSCAKMAGARSLSDASEMQNAAKG